MMTLDKDGNYIPWIQPEYGFDANDVVISPPDGYAILKQGEVLKHGDIPFDVYAGWLFISNKDFKVSHQYEARSSGRWTTYARPV